MRSVNRVFLLGNLGKDAELSYTPAGQAVSKFSLATSRRYKDKNGDLQEETEWHSIVMWGKAAEAVSQYLTKGRTVHIEGRLKYRTWEKEGRKFYATDIIAENLSLVGSGNGESRGASDPRPQRSPRPDEQPEDDDIPF